MAKKPDIPKTVAGVDVSARELVVAIERRGEVLHAKFTNDATGHRQLTAVLRRDRGLCHVVVEATGVYHLDLALHLQAAGLKVMVANPLATRRFAEAQMRRAKTDRVDADVLRQFAQRMPFEEWTAPTPEVLAFRAVTRHLSTLVEEQTAIKNRLASARATATTPKFILSDLEDQLATMATRIAACQQEALHLARADKALNDALDALTSVPGIGDRSGVLILGELSVLDRAMGPDQVVAHAGLDPRPRQSGGRDPRRPISKLGNSRLRAALYMPAVTAARCDPAVGAWYERLTSAGKHAYVAHVAVMRRLLRVGWVVVQQNGRWDASKFLPKPARNAGIEQHERATHA